MMRRSLHATAAVALAGSACSRAGPAARPGVQNAPSGSPHALPSGPALDAYLQDLIAKHRLKPLSPPPPQPAALVSLGEALFFDENLSGNRNISCSTCHDPALGTGDGLRVSVGEGRSVGRGQVIIGAGVVLARNAPPLYNLGTSPDERLFRDGRVSYDPTTGIYTTPESALNGANPARADITAVLDGALSAQTLFPLASPDEMRGHPGENELADASDNQEAWRRIVARLVARPSSRDRLSEAYPELASLDELNIGHVGRALAAYIRQRFAVIDTPYDCYLRGDQAALGEDAKRGMVLFLSKGRCTRCHSGAYLTDASFHVEAIPQIGPGVDHEGDDLGMFPHVRPEINFMYHFLTPPLRNIGKTGPYMHDGAFATLTEVLKHYRDPRAGIESYIRDQSRLWVGGDELQIDISRVRNNLRLSLLSPLLRAPIELTDEEISLLVMFLEQGLTVHRSSQEARDR